MNLETATVTKVLSEWVETIDRKEFKVYEVEYNCWGRLSITRIYQPIIKEGHQFLV